jgi:hypothetical protein
MSASFKPGDIYEDCLYHPCLCIEASDHHVSGISLIDGSQPRQCDIGACGVRHLTPQEAWRIKQQGPLDPYVKEQVPADRRWWK